MTIPKGGNPFARVRFDYASNGFSALTGLATLLIVAILFVILGNIAYFGWPSLSWRFVTGGTEKDMFNVDHAGVMPMIFGTAALVILMSIAVVPVGVITAVYLTEYTQSNSVMTRVIRGAVNNLAGVPSIVFGLFGLGFFINFVGQNMDAILGKADEPVWGKPAILWAALTLAILTLPVVIVATEEALKAIPNGLREASLALGATKLQTVMKIVIPQALPGIMTGSILAVSRGAGEVAPIMFTGAAYYMAELPSRLTDQFMELGYHVFILSTQSPDIERTRPILYATVVVLLGLTFLLNFVAILVRAQMRRKLRSLS
ncbi:MAG: phosphate ABC transporter permease PstA [Verrucomicrobia bacterium]|nr:phosphate ABC transporter permease PstA [Verrucomicrobiota bacterium]